MARWELSEAPRTDPLEDKQSAVNPTTGEASPKSSGPFY